MIIVKDCLRMVLICIMVSNILDRFKQVTNRTETSSSAVLSIELSPVLKSDTHSGTLNCSIISKKCLVSRYVLISFLTGISTIHEKFE